MKTLIIFSLLLLSCASINKIEQSHYNLYNHTPALHVLGEDNGKLVVESFTKQAVYLLRDDTFQIGDTIYLTHTENSDVFCRLRFTNFRNLFYDKERGWYCFIENRFIEGTNLKEIKQIINEQKRIIKSCE